MLDEAYKTGHQFFQHHIQKLFLSQITCCWKQEVKSREFTEHKSRGSTGGKWSDEPFQLSHSLKTYDIPTTICSEKFAIFDTILSCISISWALPLDLNSFILIWTKAPTPSIDSTTSCFFATGKYLKLKIYIYLTQGLLKPQLWISKQINWYHMSSMRFYDRIDGI